MVLLPVSSHQHVVNLPHLFAVAFGRPKVAKLPVQPTKPAVATASALSTGHLSLHLAVLLLLFAMSRHFLLIASRLFGTFYNVPLVFLLLGCIRIIHTLPSPMAVLTNRHCLLLIASRLLGTFYNVPLVFLLLGCVRSIHTHVRAPCTEECAALVLVCLVLVCSCCLLL